MNSRQPETEFEMTWIHVSCECIKVQRRVNTIFNLQFFSIFFLLSFIYLFFFLHFPILRDRERKKSSEEKKISKISLNSTSHDLLYIEFKIPQS